MGKKIPSGLRKRGEIWHIEKTYRGQRIFESTGTGDLAEAERLLSLRLSQLREEQVYGAKKARTFEQAATKYLLENQHQRAIDRAGYALKKIIPHLGAMALDKIHAETIEPYLEDRQEAGASAGTINREITVIRRILHLSARVWRDEQGRPWLETPPLLSKVQGAARKPRPITWDEQARLFPALPGYLAEMALFAVNTGCRDQEVCGLRWDWECQVPGTDATVFVLPESATKNSRERIVPLNAVARSIIEAQRGKDREYVFTFEGHRLDRMSNKAWYKARESVGLESVRVHDLRHTFGMRLRAAGVGFEDRQDLLGHHVGRITTHYSQAEIAHLIECVERLCETESERKPEFALVRRRK